MVLLWLFHDAVSTADVMCRRKIHRRMTVNDETGGVW
jgi:hypothetical protein